MHTYKSKIINWTETNDHRWALILFAVNFFLVFAVFLPNFSDLNPWDEAAYIAGGQELVEGSRLPNFAGNPLTALFFALTYLPFRSSPLWMVHSISLARVILFILLWVSTYLIASQFSKFAPTMISMGIFLVTPLIIEFMRFPSDPLFAALAGFSLWQLFLFKKTTERKHLVASSAFIALAALARNDGLIVFGILCVLVVILTIKNRDFLRSLLAVLLPFIVLIGGYWLIFGILTGDFELGTMERTYQNFESGQQIVFSDSGEFSPVVESRLEARKLFGTAEENDYSVFKAIQRNPQEYLKRLLAITKRLPDKLLHAYGIRFAVLLFVLMGRAIFELLKQREYTVLALLCLWPLHLITGFIITIFRLGHLQFPFYIVFVLASIGLYSILSNLDTKVERTWITILMVGLCVYSIVDNKLAIFYGAAVFLVVIWIIYVLQKYQKPRMISVSLLLILAAGIILRGNFPSPKIRELGLDPKEQAILFITENFSPNTTFAAGAPGVVWASKMGYAGLASWDVPKDKTSEEFIDWMADQGIEAIYVDHDLYNVLPGIWKLIEPQIGISLERVFEAERGNFQVLTFTP
jgi:hypothetical protein